MTRWMMQRLGWLALGAMLALGARAQTAPDDAAMDIARAPKPTEAVDPANCVTAECHGEVISYSVTHGPVAARTCDACHELTSAKDHTFKLWREKEKICTYCHEFDTGMLPVVHKPVILGECLGCHNPHGGTNHSLTREATIALTCGRCHESVTFGKEFLHYPEKTGDCTACHRPHASKYPKLLDAVGTDLCLACHNQLAGQMTTVQFMHKTLEDGCTQCHATHGSNNPMELTKSVPQLCLGCHEDVRDIAAKASYKHSVVMDECSCLTCHSAHASNLAFLMRDLPSRICTDCHKEKVPPGGVEMMTAMLRINDPTRFKHAPVREGQCGGCHTIHGGDTPLLLRKAYPSRFHEPFSVEKYELCFDCHNKRMVEDEQANSVTQFRDGNRNLHYLHVTVGDIGRNCRVCHGIHTARFDALIRDRVPYGNWQMATRFDKTATGGSCATGCHAQLSYDRVNPVGSSAIALATQNAPRVPVADKRQPVMATLAARDIRGADVRVPVEGRPSVLVFLRPDQNQSGQVLKFVSAANPRITAAQVVVVFCGEKAEQAAASFATTSTLACPVVADPEFAVSASLGVQTWPATLVVQPDGVLVAHIGGVPISLTAQLEDYLDLAARKIDRDTLRQRLAQLDLVGEQPSEHATWHLEVGRKLLEQGKAEQARAMLAEGLKLKPGSIELQVEMVRALLELKQADTAMEILDKIPPDALPRWDRDLLRGRVLAGRGQWDEARSVAVALLKEAPDLPGAHYLMGMIYENDREWELAVREYRAASAKGAR